MDNTLKNLFLVDRYSNPNYSICNSNEKDTWLYVLLKCTNPIIHGLIVQRHNKAVWKIRKLLLFNPTTCCYTIMNARKFLKAPRENSVPQWLLQCSYNTPRCQCNARFKPDILCIQSITHNGTPPLHSALHIKIQFIEFTYTND